ncbi:MAG: [NiFe]-hydrogenase assembly chaperone HybE [Halothiobacillaceae bacterium]
MMAPAEELAQIGQTLVQAYTQIQHTRMRGLPIVNSALQVEAVGLRPWGGLCVGVLVTPWCMNLLALPMPGGRALPPVPTGTACTLDLPAGRYDLLAAHLPQIGHHLSGSLYSPMDEFASQDEAVTAAYAALGLLFDPTAATPLQAVAESASVLPNGAVDASNVSRRSFLFPSSAG